MAKNWREVAEEASNWVALAAAVGTVIFFVSRLLGVPYPLLIPLSLFGAIVWWTDVFGR